MTFLPEFYCLMSKSSTQRQHLFSNNFPRLLCENDEDCLTTKGRSSAVAAKYQENLRALQNNQLPELSDLGKQEKYKRAA